MILRLRSSISTTYLSAGCVVLLAWGTASAQTKSQSPTAATLPTPAHTSSATKLQNVSAHSTSRKNKKSRKSASSRHGQQKIDPTRCREIQEALVREHYLDSASGTWDAKSQSAMQRYQADNGWQSKSVPDSRALIKMGLGPDHEHLLNPESAMTSQPEAPRAAPMLTPAMIIPAQK
jgi:hypothetical protein